MARNSSPWFWQSRNCWAVIISGQRYLLGENPQDASPPRKNRKNKWVIPTAIQDRFDDLKVSLRTATPTLNTNPSVPQPTTVAEVFTKFLEWCATNRAPRTHEWTRNHLQSFVEAMEHREERIDLHTFPAASVRPFHITEWVDSKTRWGANHKRGAITAVQRAFNWAAKAGHIAASPIRGIEKPPPKRREQVLTRVEFDRLLALVPDEAFHAVLEFCWETGCRAQEVRILEASHYRADRGRLELPPQLAKGKKRWRLIYLTPRANQIVRELVGRYPTGVLFRNTNGNPWDAQNFNCRFCRIQRRLGREAIGPSQLDPKDVAALARRLKPVKLAGGQQIQKTTRELLREARKKLAGRVAAKAGTKYTLTSIRHSFCQRLLEAGVDHTTVAALMGHSNAVMVATTYSHMDQAKDFLREELLRAAKGGNEG